MEKLLPLLSGSLKEALIRIVEKHKDCDLSKELIIADEEIEKVNDYQRRVELFSKDAYFKNVSNVRIECSKNIINSLITDFGRMISFRLNTFSLSFLPEGKIAEYNDNGDWSRTNRQEMKPARLAQKILVKKHSCKEFEDFSNYLKAEIMCNGEFRIVSGSDITKYYNENNYQKLESTLAHSCMRYDYCETYFELYEDTAKMLVYINPDTNCIYGRAIVWEIDGKTYMDRVYYAYDYLLNIFIDYAREHKWFYRSSNDLLNDGDRQLWFSPEDEYKYPEYYELFIEPGKIYNNYPYVDTFRYLDTATGTISTSPDFGDAYMSDTEGGYSGRLDLYTCERCGREERSYCDGECPDDWHYSEYDECYYCPDCCVYCDGIDDWVSKNYETVGVYDEDGVYRTFPLCMIKHNSSYEYLDGDWYNVDNPNVMCDENGDYWLLPKE